MNSCGAPRNGGALIPSEPAPSGTVVASSSLAGINGQVASGTASLYRQSLTQYVLRFESLQLPSESGLSFILRTDGADRAAVLLRARLGTQNYPIAFTAAPTSFNEVRIRSSQQGLDCAMASF